MPLSRQRNVYMPANQLKEPKTYEYETSQTLLFC